MDREAWFIDKNPEIASHTRDMAAEANLRINALHAANHAWDDPISIAILGIKYSVLEILPGVIVSQRHTEAVCTFKYEDQGKTKYYTPAGYRMLEQYLEKLRQHCVDTGTHVVDYTWRD
jgi:L-asparaginase/Glu-tRNA(Gln) amidotransferase subunit D